jgi:hypothetical protein
VKSKTAHSSCEKVIEENFDVIECLLDDPIIFEDVNRLKMATFSIRNSPSPKPIEQQPRYTHTFKPTSPKLLYKTDLKTRIIPQPLFAR